MDYLEKSMTLCRVEDFISSGFPKNFTKMSTADPLLLDFIQRLYIYLLKMYPTEDISLLLLLTAGFRLM